MPATKRRRERGLSDLEASSCKTRGLAMEGPRLTTARSVTGTKINPIRLDYHEEEVVSSYPSDITPRVKDRSGTPARAYANNMGATDLAYNRRYDSMNLLDDDDTFTMDPARDRDSTSFGSPRQDDVHDSIKRKSDSKESTALRTGRSHKMAAGFQPNVYLDRENCLQKVREVYPDIAHVYVYELFESCKGSIYPMIQMIMEQDGYPKEQERKAKEPSMQKESSAEAEQREFSAPDRQQAKGRMRKAIVAILKDEFPKIPVGFIAETQTKGGHLYPTYLVLVDAEAQVNPPWGRASWRAVSGLSVDDILQNYGVEHVAADLEREVLAARKKRKQSEARRREQEARRKAEKFNLEHCKSIGRVAECSTCFDETALNRMIVCNGQPSHATCYECMTTYITAEVGQARCTLTCPDVSACSGIFTIVQLHKVPDQKLVRKLLDLQQEQDVRNAGLDDVVQCPFCDFKTVCPPLEVDFEFRCENSECTITSCRKCQKHTHVPFTCEEAARAKNKDAAVDQRHKIEEAMTAALVRNCNKCKKPFVKEMGCNKMYCPSCGNKQCYVCSETITDYDHFHRNKCPLHDNVEQRHSEEVKKAETEARAKIEAENPEISKKDLDFQMSEHVRQAEERRRAQLGPPNYGFDGFHPARVAAGGALADRAAYEAHRAENARFIEHVNNIRRAQERLERPAEVNRRRAEIKVTIRHIKNRQRHPEAGRDALQRDPPPFGGMGLPVQPAAQGPINERGNRAGVEAVPGWPPGMNLAHAHHPPPPQFLEHVNAPMFGPGFGGIVPRMHHFMDAGAAPGILGHPHAPLPWHPHVPPPWHPHVPPWHPHVPPLGRERPLHQAGADVPFMGDAMDWDPEPKADMARPDLGGDLQ